MLNFQRRVTASIVGVCIVGVGLSGFCYRMSINETSRNNSSSKLQQTGNPQANVPHIYSLPISAMKHIVGASDPIVYRGQTTYFTTAPYYDPDFQGAVGTWVVYDNGQSIATSSNKNGWDVGFDKSTNTVSISVPASASVNANYDAVRIVGPKIRVGGNLEAQGIDPSFEVQ